MRRALPTFALFAFAASVFASACSSAPPAPPQDATSAGTTGVTVVGWSLRDQSPVPAVGVLRQNGREVARFDTRAKPDSTTVPVSPGPYEVQVTHRASGSRLIAVTGLERVDARPGEIVRCEVVIDDREGGDAATPVDNSR